VTRVELGDEVRGAGRDVLAAFSEQRQLEGRDLQAVEQVRAEAAFCD